MTKIDYLTNMYNPTLKQCNIDTKYDYEHMIHNN